jgi:hypothetical protein
MDSLHNSEYLFSDCLNNLKVFSYLKPVETVYYYSIFH